MKLARKGTLEKNYEKKAVMAKHYGFWQMDIWIKKRKNS